MMKVARSTALFFFPVSKNFYSAIRFPLSSVVVSSVPKKYFFTAFSFFSAFSLCGAQKAHCAFHGGLEELILKEDLEAVRALAKSGVDLSQMTCREEPLLAFAILEGKTQMAELLLELGMDPNQPATSGYSPIMLAIQASDELLVVSLFNQKVNLSYVNPKTKETLWHVAALSKSPLTIFPLLSSVRSLLNEIDVNGNTALILAKKHLKADAERGLKRFGAI